MDSDSDNVFVESDSDFVVIACKLLKEYTDRTQKKKSELSELIDKMNLAGPGKTLQILSQRAHFETMSFQRALTVYSKLIRKVSQWVEHAKSAPPGLQLELEMRLAELEFLVDDLEMFIKSNL